MDKRKTSKLNLDSCLYVLNIKMSTTNEELKKLFSVFGNISRARSKVVKNSVRVAWIYVESPKLATSLIKAYKTAYRQIRKQIAQGLYPLTDEEVVSKQAIPQLCV
jgi:RNA recognition motif-containing protein